MRYLALLRGVNVGGHNKIAMPELKAACAAAGFTDVATYINSGNVIFDSDLDAMAVKTTCQQVISDAFDLAIPVGIITAGELHSALAHAPDWWNADQGIKHNAIFVIAPATAASVCTEVGAGNSDYEKLAYYGQIIFWSAPLATFSRTRWSKITQHREAYNAITIRNANTTLKLLELVGEKF